MLVVLLEVPLLLFALFLKLVVSSTLDVFLDFYLRRFQHHEELRNYFRHPFHIIVHHKVLLTW